MTQGRAQDPGAAQDAEAAREKQLKAADTLDNIEANSEATKTAVDGMKPDITKLQADVSKLQSDNAALQQQVNTLQDALQKSEAAHVKERQVILDEVAKLVASGKSSAPVKSTPKKKEAAASEDHSSSSSDDKTATADTSAPVDHPTKPTAATKDDSSSSNLAPPPDPTPTPAPVKTQKGYYHIVAEGETLTLICNAYRQDGVNVSVSQVMRANGLTDKSILKVGQKLFIPKPGT